MPDRDQRQDQRQDQERDQDAPPTGRVTVLVLAALAAGGWVLRAGPVLYGGTFTVGTDYDDAVNFSVAGLLTEGVLPYRDFFYAHPPGGILALTPFAALGRWIGYDDAFVLAGLAMTVVGALTVFLLGRFCWRAWGPVAGIAAATLYAWHPHALIAERTTFMEPLLNLGCVTLATVWIGRGGAISGRRALWAGVAAGAAVSLKLWAFPWILAAFIAVPAERRREVLSRFAIGAGAVLAVAVVPLMVVGIGSAFDDVIGFHLRRPPDGGPALQRTYELFGFLDKSRNIFSGPHAPTSLMALAGLAVALVRARRPGARAERMVGAAYVLTLIWLMAAAVYYTHYNAHLALAECAAAGLGASAAWNAVRRFTRAPAWGRHAVAAAGGAAVLAVGLVAVPVSASAALDGARARVPENRLIGAEIRALPPDACVLAFEPIWTLSASRLPSRVKGQGSIPDPYGFMLHTSIRAGTGRLPTVTETFESEVSQGKMRAFLGGCRYVVMGWRGYFQLSDASEAWLKERFVVLPVGPSGLEIWERTGASASAGP